MTKKLKVYVVSFMAIQPYYDMMGAGISFEVPHHPAIIPAYSAKEAAELTRAVALERWPLDEGWHSHQAAVLPVTKAFYEAARTALFAGVVDMEDEPEYGEIFKFS
jgi:hypothetical protein